MNNIHGWRECKPALVSIDPRETPEQTAKMRTEIAAVWETLTDADRIGFHRYCCHNRHDSATLATMERITQLVQAATAHTRQIADDDS